MNCVKEFRKFLVSYIGEKSLFPSISEIQKCLRIKTKMATLSFIEQLQKEGVIDFTPYRKDIKRKSQGKNKCDTLSEPVINHYDTTESEVKFFFLNKEARDLGYKAGDIIVYRSPAQGIKIGDYVVRQIDGEKTIVRFRNEILNACIGLVEGRFGVVPSGVQKKKRLLSLFSGGGGMDIGFEGGFEIPKPCINRAMYPDWVLTENKRKVFISETSIETVFANDIDPFAEKAWSYYFAQRRNVRGVFQTKSIVDLVKNHEKGTFVFPDNIDIVTGGFPCNDFSVSGKRKGFDSHRMHSGELRTEEATEESRGKLYMWMKRVVEITKPKVFFAENVKGLVSLADVKTIIENDFRKISGGYIVIPARVLFAPDYGVPQTRERVIFIGFRRNALTPAALNALRADPIPPEYDPYPPATHDKKGEGVKQKYVCSRDVLVDLPEPGNSSDLSQQTFSRAKYMGPHCQGQKEISWDRPAPTIRAEHHGNIEYRRLSAEHGGVFDNELQRGLQERRLTVRECARIQTFPDDYEFIIKSPEPVFLPGLELPSSEKGSYIPSTAGYRIIGNAVPPLLGYHLARRIEALWENLFGGE